VASWITCLLENVPALAEASKLFQDVEKVKLAIWIEMKNLLSYFIAQEKSPINLDVKCFQHNIVPRRCFDIYCLGLSQIYLFSFQKYPQKSLR
jgi:hypothetical protein